MEGQVAAVAGERTIFRFLLDRVSIFRAVAACFLPWMAGDSLQLRMVSVWAVNSLQLLLRKLAAVLA